MKMHAWLMGMCLYLFINLFSDSSLDRLNCKGGEQNINGWEVIWFCLTG